MNEKRHTNRVVPYQVYEGNAAEDIDPDSVVLKVICPELTPQAISGTLGAGITSSQVKLKDRDGNPIQSPVTTSNHIVATWDGSSNSRTPPLIRKGEPVEIFKRADQDKFYWRTTGRGRDFRKTDRITVEVGATDPNKPSQEKSDKNTYSAYLDSHNQKVGLTTSKVNGEAMALKMEADLKQGTFYISDDSESPGNRIFLDAGTLSGNPTFQVNLTSGVVLKFEGDNAFIKVPKKLEIDAGERLIFNSPLTVFNLSQKGAFIVNASSIAINAAKDFIVSTTVAGFNAVSTKISGILAAAQGRIDNLVKGPIGGSYSPATIQRPEETPVNIPSNSPDTSMTGLPYRN